MHKLRLYSSVMNHYSFALPRRPATYSNNASQDQLDKRYCQTLMLESHRKSDEIRTEMTGYRPSIAGSGGGGALRHDRRGRVGVWALRHLQGASKGREEGEEGRREGECQEVRGRE